jgi:hypothetical protein
MKGVRRSISRSSCAAINPHIKFHNLYLLVMIDIHIQTSPVLIIDVLSFLIVFHANAKVRIRQAPST